MKKIVALVAAVAIVILIVAVISFQMTATPVETAVVEQGSIESFLDERGTTRLPRTYDISMPFAGRIEEIDLEVGDTVASGEILAQVSQVDLDNEVAEAQAVVDRLTASIAENDDTRLEDSLVFQSERFVESMSYTVDAAAVRLSASEDRMNFAETTLGRLTQLIDDNAISQEVLDEAQLRFEEARKGYTQDNFILQSVTAIQAATDLMPNMVRDYIDKKTLSRAVLEQQRNEALSRLSDAQTRRQRGSMTSPVDGVILERDRFAPQFVNAGDKLLSVGDLGELEIETDVLSQDAVYVRPGAAVEIYGPATGREFGHGFVGHIKRVSPQGFSRLSTLGVEQQRVTVWITIRDEDREALIDNRIGVGYRVRVRINTGRQESTLILPRAAIFRSPTGLWQVFVVRGGRARLVEVEVGLINDEFVEIVSGVDEGSRVVLAPESSLVDGTRVRNVSR